MILKWLVAVLAALGGFVTAGITGAFAAELLGFWHLPGAGFSAAATVVILAYIAAPRHKLLTALIVLTIGAVAAWLTLEPSWLPESYAERGAYQPTHLPIIATYVGALAGLAAVIVMRIRSRRDNDYGFPPSCDRSHSA